MRRAQRSPAGRTWDWRFVVAGLLYLGLVVGVVLAETTSELSKYERGSYSDTFDPLLGAWLLTLPLSLLTNAALPELDRPDTPEQLRTRAGGFLLTGLVQGGLLVFLGTPRGDRRHPRE